ncbi:hypothetical protein OS493_035996 [Desmophyllum pertusum]|uniref:Uncharacterized protein n=1 Tax=Desmophyllum pertusum TaxID=174260 RepID=A0A9W9ZXC8_9CNID|nr:hypothetical protein OS493_035996 [Desmophyllum pertusum]
MLNAFIKSQEMTGVCCHGNFFPPFSEACQSESNQNCNCGRYRFARDKGTHPQANSDAKRQSSYAPDRPPKGMHKECTRHQKKKFVVGHSGNANEAHDDPEKNKINDKSLFRAVPT